MSFWSKIGLADAETLMNLQTQIEELKQNNQKLQEENASYILELQKSQNDVSQSLLKGIETQSGNVIKAVEEKHSEIYKCVKDSEVSIGVKVEKNNSQFVECLTKEIMRVLEKVDCVENNASIRGAELIKHTDAVSNTLFDKVQETSQKLDDTISVHTESIAKKIENVQEKYIEQVSSLQTESNKSILESISEGFLVNERKCFALENGLGIIIKQGESSALLQKELFEDLRNGSNKDRTEIVKCITEETKKYIDIIREHRKQCHQEHEELIKCVSNNINNVMQKEDALIVTLNTYEQHFNNVQDSLASMALEHKKLLENFLKISELREKVEESDRTLLNNQEAMGNNIKEVVDRLSKLKEQEAEVHKSIISIQEHFGELEAVKNYMMSLWEAMKLVWINDLLDDIQ